MSLITSFWLQWSHVFSDMVRWGVSMIMIKIQIIASMEPCLFRHGKEHAVIPEHPSHLAASMEPCLFRHGKSAPRERCRGAGTGFNGAMSFQTW
ncbi:protein of unknown function [Methanoculleus bourgensis]|uniref:Uncharacterized protein n=1 Tax=Methanoculleus bourgensis TaxID=83986 RepID=A0A0X8XYP9_9EURY|nr:protein of unknown function [Methanoculleus bourgensis]